MPDNQIAWKDIERAAMHDTTLQALVAVVRGDADRRLIAAVLELSKLEHERDGAQSAETVDAASWNAMTVETLRTLRHLGESHRKK